MDKLMKKLENPTKEYRAVPFWSWNDKLDNEMLGWQIREMDKAGLGGYFMHARGGLQTEYMGSEWMECVKTCIDEGNKLGMNSWCYDEHGWPSGFGGGVVTAMGDKYHVRWLKIEEVQGEIHLDKQVLGVYALDEMNKQITRINVTATSVKSKEGQKLLVISHKSNPYYIDILNEEVIKAFIDSTYEKYYSHFKEYFGKGMPGFFTDEPQFSRGELPWSYILPEKFSQRFGYDLLGNLPALFIECSGFEKVRYDFWSLVNELYVTSFGKQIYDWCEEHDCKFTGHVMMEDSIYSQMGATAGAMPFYEYMHIPGMDWLGRQICSPVIPRQVGSAASQLGKKFVLSETFALCGWDVSFEELKWIAEWQYVNGVNLMCQHLEGYTLRGLRKRDYPPSLFVQQSWWEEYKQFNDYFARLGMLLTEGRSGAEVLLLHPVKSGWISYDGSNSRKLDKLDKDFVKATEMLSDLHFDHHYGDETIIRSHGEVRDNLFIVGECSYKVVILPSMLTIDSFTLELLSKFMDCGGKVIGIGDLPEFCQGTKNPAIEEFNKKLIHMENHSLLRNLLTSLKVPGLSISDGSGEIGSIHYQQRNMDGSKMFFIVNHDQKNTYNAVVRLSGNGAVKRYVAEKAVLEDMNYEHDGGDTVLNLTFLPMQSYILVFEDSNEKAAPLVICKEDRVSLNKEWVVEEMDLNSLTLDYCDYSIDNAEWIGPVHTIKLMNLLLKLGRECDIALRFNFNVDMELGKNKELLLVVEVANEFDISINGRSIETCDIGWWKDSSFKKVNIREHVKPGENEVILRRRFYQSQKVYEVLFGENVLETEKNKMTYDVELESIYIVGDFGVISKSGYTYGERKAVFTDGSFVITDAPQKAESGDLTKQGFCFFAGSVKLSQSLHIAKNKGNKVILELDKPDAILSKVLINGTEAGFLPWAPYSIDITDFVDNGENKVTVQLYAGNRNLLGPHHNVEGESYSVGPGTFTDKPGWSDDAAITDVWRDRYCFVKFGPAE